MKKNWLRWIIPYCYREINFYEGKCFCLNIPKDSLDHIYIYIYKYIYIYIYIINYNARVRLLSHLFATLSFMLHVEQSSGNCQKKRLQSKIFENAEQ